MKPARWRRWLALATSAVRVTLAAALVLLCWQDWPSANARMQLDALPDFDYTAAAETLLAKQRYGEAELVIDQGLAAGSPSQQAELRPLRARVEGERDSLARKLRDAGTGALTGTGESTEAMAGAVAADLLVFGDIRDLAIQGSHALRGEPTDDVIVALSSAGIALSLAPEVDWGVALLKFGRRLGVLGDALAKNIARLARRAIDTHDASNLTGLADDMATLSRSAHPAGAMAIVRNVDDAGTLHAAAQFAAEPGGAFALWVGERSSLDLLATADRGGDTLLLRAARKGRAGIDFALHNTTLMLRVHPLLGLIKGMWKGDLPKLISSLLQEHAAAVFGCALGWLAYELGLLAIRLAERPFGAATPANTRYAAPRRTAQKA